MVLGDSDLDLKEVEAVENHLYRSEVQEALKSGFGKSRRFSTTVQEDMLYTATVFGRDKNKGIVRLSIPLYEINQVQARLRKLLVTAFFLTFLCAAIISFLIAAFISRPIEEMPFFTNSTSVSRMDASMWERILPDR